MAPPQTWSSVSRATASRGPNITTSSGRSSVASRPAPTRKEAASRCRARSCSGTRRAGPAPARTRRRWRGKKMAATRPANSRTARNGADGIASSRNSTAMWAPRRNARPPPSQDSQIRRVARRLLGPGESIIEEVAGEDTEQHDTGHQRGQPGDEEARQVQQRAIEDLEHHRPWEARGSAAHATIAGDAARPGVVRAILSRLPSASRRRRPP